MVTQRALTIGELFVALLAIEFADGQALGQTGGCARCGSSGLAPLGASASRWTGRLVWREEAPRREGRKRETSEVATLGGSYTVCVRTVSFQSPTPAKQAASMVWRRCAGRCAPTQTWSCIRFPLAAPSTRRSPRPANRTQICPTQTDFSKSTIRAAPVVVGDRARRRRLPEPRRDMAIDRAIS